MSMPGVDQAERLAWIERNTILCARYDTRLSPASCERQQAANPERCKGCERVTGEVVPPARSPFGYQVRKKVMPSTKSKHRVGECAECKRVMPLPGRGLCGKCYAAALKAECRTGKARGRAVAEKPPVDGCAPVAVPLAEAGSAVPVCGVADPLAWLFAGEEEMMLRIAEAARQQRRDVRNQVLFYLDQVV